VTGRLRPRATTWFDDFRGGLRSIVLEAFVVIVIVFVALVTAAIAIAVT
jgi:hypothetical protein